MQLLPGYPQILFFTAQLIALRVAWAVDPACAAAGGARDGERRWSCAASLAAVQFLPSLEVSRDSVRMGPLGPGEIGAG